MILEAMEVMEAMASLEEAFILKHLWNRITTANLSKHTFENTRAALDKTIAGITDPDDIQYLRKDRQLARNQMMRIIEKHPDPEQRREAKKHLAWLESEYVKMLSNRMAELKAKHESGPLTEMTFDFTKMSGNGSTYACLVPASGETKRLLDLVVSTRPPFTPDTLRDEAHVTLVYSREAQVDVVALDAGLLGIQFPRVEARVVSVEVTSRGRLNLHQFDDKLRQQLEGYLVEAGILRPDQTLTMAEVDIRERPDLGPQLNDLAEVEE